ncbi:transposase [Streptomyces mirabilis]|uniref:transposase n=1 Tax=Streptomyces mirabilis TaxID=68239 RepID=UPI003682296D
MLVAEIGDVHRFPSADRLCSWSGLTPRHYESDTVARRGHVTKQGSKLVRWAVVGRLSSARPPPRPRRIGPGSRPAAARTSRRPPRPANCSPWSATGCATGTSAPWPARPREQVGGGRRAVGQLSDPHPARSRF